MGALDGYKILDFTTLLPGPYATMTLADMGAEVLKVSGRDRKGQVRPCRELAAGRSRSTGDRGTGVARPQ